MSKIYRFTSKSVQLAKNAVNERGEVAAPKGCQLRRICGGVAALSASLPGKILREALDLPSEMPQILGKIGLNAAHLPDFSTQIKWFNRIKTALWRNVSKHYCHRTDYRVQTLKATALVGT
jgi:IS5 family transposase